MQESGRPRPAAAATGRVRAFTLRVIERWRGTWRDVLAASIAAGIAWMLAHRLFGHPAPIFAAISAIICLAPGLPSHAGQAIGLLIGVATGIVIGELALFLPADPPLVRLTLASLAAML